MIEWGTAVATVCLGVLVYFLYRGMRIAFSSKEPPDPPEGDYEIKVLGRLKGGRMITIMSPTKDKKQ